MVRSETWLSPLFTHQNMYLEFFLCLTYVFNLPLTPLFSTHWIVFISWFSFNETVYSLIDFHWSFADSTTNAWFTSWMRLRISYINSSIFHISFELSNMKYHSRKMFHSITLFIILLWFSFCLWFVRTWCEKMQ